MPTLLCLGIIFFLHLILLPSPLHASFPVQAGEVEDAEGEDVPGQWYWRGPGGAATPVPGFAAARTAGSFGPGLAALFVRQPPELRVGCRQPAGPQLPEAASYQDRPVSRVGQAD